MDHYKRVGIEAEKVEKGVDYGIYHTTFKIKDDPLVSVIIPNKDHTVDLDNCIRPMLTEGTYKNLEFVIVENNSTEQATWDYYEKIQKEFPNVHVVRWERVQLLRDQQLRRTARKGRVPSVHEQRYRTDRKEFCGRDAWLCPEGGRGDQLMARLLYEDDTIQHAYVVIGFGGIA